MFKYASWIWSGDSVNEKNIYVRFRRTFDAETDIISSLRISANARYAVYLNGRWLGQGPPRAWPQHYEYDVYEISQHLRTGENVLAVLVHHFGVGSMQWLPSAPGLIAELELSASGKTKMIATNEDWRVSRHLSYEQRVPRISIQMGFEEQFDARKSSQDWLEPGYDEKGWARASIVGDEKDGPVRNLSQRTIPQLTARTVFPIKLQEVDSIRSKQKIWSIDLRPYFNPDDKSADFMVTAGFLFTQIYADQATEVIFTRLQARRSQIRLNGRDVHADRSDGSYYFPVFKHKLELKAGWNSLLVDFHQREHLTRMVCAIGSHTPLNLAWNGEAGAPWALLGPFDSTESVSKELSCFPFSNVVTTTLRPGASRELADALWDAGGPHQQGLPGTLVVPIQKKDIAEDDVFARALTDEADRNEPGISSPEFLITDDKGWSTINPNKNGAGARLLFDFGREIVGYLSFEIDAADGTVLDFVGFENIGVNGNPDWTEGVNNSLRYVCRNGRQKYRSYWRRGLRYLYVIIRQTSSPVKLREMAVIENIFPQKKRGNFLCSDSALDMIWKTGSHTMACCSEDTYVDCPAYEQVHWVGDARNEALVDWIVNGDGRLWKHCLLQAGYSLERSPLVESHVPSAWPIILPAWSFLWLRSCYEYYLFTGDRDGTQELWPWIKRNIDGVKKYINKDGLLEIRAWNMFDWAEMDTPDDGVVTHQNCLLVLALQEIARLTGWLERKAESKTFTTMAEKLSQAINRHLYDTGREAYSDSLHADGELSPTLSQQTQTVALASGVARGKRAEKARSDMLNPPKGYALAGSPFFMFFLLEVLMNEGETTAVVDEIREKWGFMIDHGATTFWEMWSGKEGRLTRSHCHGWSAAPTFFLSTYILGVMPVEPGFARTRIAPHPGGLRWARGSVPTPYGNIRISWEKQKGKPFSIQIRAPKQIQLDIIKPEEDARVSVVEE